MLSALAPGLSEAGESEPAPAARVILQFATTADRDAAYTRLIEGGAAVRVADTEAGPALVAIGSAALLDSEGRTAAQMSPDARVSITADYPFIDRPAGANWERRTEYHQAADLARSPEGIAVAVIDSGIQPHADLPLSRVRAFVDFVSGSPTPVDGCGHGTHVAGIIAGDGRSSDGAYAGIAPAADIVSLRVLDDDCSGHTSDVIDALEWIGRNHGRYRIKVVNLSLGHAVLESIFTDPLVQAVERLARKGVTVVTAAGNRGVNPATGRPGYGGAGVPCNAPSAICVGSLDTLGSVQLDDDRVSDTSSRGPTRFDLLSKPDLVAPGVNIVSLSAPGSRLFNEFQEYRVAGTSGEAQYFVLSGSSMASPVVAAAAALLLQANQALPTNTLKLALQFTARVVPQTDVLAQGAGALNVAGAIVLAGAIDTEAARATNWIRHRLTAANLDAFGQFIPWGQRIIYGDRFMQPRYAQIHLVRWDDEVVWAYDSIADRIARDNMVWGANAADDNIVWGRGALSVEWTKDVVEGFWWDNDGKP